MEKGKEQRNERRGVEKEEMATEEKSPFISDGKIEERRSLYLSFKPLKKSNGKEMLMTTIL